MELPMEVTPDTIFDFTKRLVQLGGIYEVQEDLSIMNTVSNSLVAIPSGKKSIPLKVFKDGMTSGEFAILMPYKEQLGPNREREWFFDSLQIVLGNLVKELMLKIIQDVVEKKDENLAQYPLANLISGIADATMLKELDKLRAHDLLYVNYNKKTKVASALSRIIDEDLIEEHSKFRKKSWEVFQLLFKEIVGSLDPEELYTYQSTILVIPETDAKLHVIVALTKALGAYARDILNIDLGEDVLEKHLANLEGYHNLHAWVSATSSTVKDEPVSRPWDNTPSFSPAASHPVNMSSGFAPGGYVSASSVNNSMSFGGSLFQPQQQFTGGGLFGGVVPASSIVGNNGHNNGPFGCW